jgi:hypothetical protein
MSTQLYRITRTGAQHVRWEWPNGEPVKEPRMTRSASGHYVPKIKHGGPASKVVYGTPRTDRNTGLPIVGVRNTIRLTPEGAKALAHMGLVPVSSPPEVKPVEPEKGPDGPSGGAHVGGIEPDKLYSGKQVGELVDAINDAVQNGVTDKGAEPDPKAKVPEDWRELSESRQRGIAARISGQPKDDITAAQAVAIIEAHLAAGAAKPE